MKKHVKILCTFFLALFFTLALAACINLPEPQVPEIGPNGNWWIRGVDTGKPAQGYDGKDAYQIWLDNPDNAGKTEAEFFAWLKGLDGQTGKQGDNGLSAYETYKRYHLEKYGFDYSGDETRWIRDLINGRLTEYTVAFDTQGGGLIEPIEIRAGYQVLKPSNPGKSGYVFAGWYTDEACRFEWDLEVDHVRNDMTLYAAWDSTLPATQGLKFTPVAGNANAYEVSKGTANTNGRVVIPSRYNGIPVKRIADSGFYVCQGMTEVVMPFSITNIGAQAFNSCISLAGVVIPAGVISIALNAFSECEKLASVTFAEGSTLEFVGNGAFAFCASLTKIIIPSSVKYVFSGAFSHCTNLANIIIYEGVKSVGSQAFESCSSLSNVVIPSSVVSIEFGAFSNCTGLESVIFAEGSQIDAIPDGMFFNCKSLVSVVIPASVSYIGDRAFNDCTALTKVFYGGTDSSAWNKINIVNPYDNNLALTNAIRHYYSVALPFETGNFWRFADGIPTAW